MSDIERNARIAGQELELTEKALSDIRAEAMEAAARQKDPDTAFRELQMVKAVDLIRTKLRAYENTYRLAQDAQAKRQAET